MTISNDPLYVEVNEVLEGFKKRMTDRIEKGQQKQKAYKIKNVIESKLAQEMKLNAELKARLADMSKRGDDLDQICNNFSSGLKISDSDQNRLDNANRTKAWLGSENAQGITPQPQPITKTYKAVHKEMYQIGKDLTGIRFDFSAPPDVAKGYIKCERRMALCPFEESANGVPERLWTLLRDTWQAGKENVKPQ